LSYQGTLNFEFQVYYENIAIMGMQGDGKTTQARKILDTIPNVPRWIWSPMRPTENYEGYGKYTDKIEELTRGFFIFTGEFNEKNFLAFINKAKAQHDLLLVIDDCHEFCTKQFLPDEWKTLILSYRNKGIHSIFLSPFPNQVHNTILGSCAHVFCFRFTLESQIEWVRKNVFGNQAWILLSRDLRQKDDPAWPDKLEKYSYMYRNMNHTENQLMSFGQVAILTQPKESNEDQNEEKKEEIEANDNHTD